MDTPIFCVYNLAKRVFLSSKVTVADTVSQPLKVLKDLVALDAESGLWLTPLHGRPTIPKLFPYDLAYLDNDFHVVEMVEVVPGIDFPPHRREVTSAVVLPPETLRSSQTGLGDSLIVCPKEEIQGRLAGANPAAQDSVAKNHEPAVLEAPAEPGEKTQPVSNGPPGAEPVVSCSPVLAEDAPPPPPPQVGPISGKREGSGTRTPAVSITEVVIEKPHASERQVRGTVEHRAGLDDLFANWVDSPSAPPSWIAQKARERESKASSALEDSVSPKAPSRDSTKAETNGSPTGTPHAVGKEPEPVQPAANLSSVEPAPMRTAAESVAIPAKSPSTTRVTQGPPVTTSTIGQYGIWHLSIPGAAVPHTPVSGSTSQFPGLGSPGTKPVEGSKAENRATESTAPASTPRQTPEFPSRSGTVRAGNPAPAVHQGPKALEANTPSPVQTFEVPPRKVELPPAGPVAESMSKEPGARVSDARTQPAGASPLQSGEMIWAAKPSPADFGAAIQAKMDRLEIPTPGTKVPEPRAISASGKKSFASNSQQETKAKPAPRTAPAAPGAKPGNPNSLEQKNELAVTPPKPPFLKPKPDQKEKLKISIPRVESNGKKGAESQGFGARLKRWLNPIPSSKSDRRRALRRYVPGMVAFYYTGGAPKPHQVADISMSGFYLLTEDRWVPETMIRMTLQKPCAKGERKQSITVLSRIIRRGSDGIAAEFVMQESLDSSSRDVLPSQATDRFALARFL